MKKKLKYINKFTLEVPFKKRPERKMKDGTIDERWKFLKRIYLNKYTLPLVINGNMNVMRSICYKPEAMKKSTELWIPEDGVPYEDYGVIPKYRVGDILAIAMNFEDIAKYWKDKDKICYLHSMLEEGKSGWYNKKYVDIEKYPYRIKITDVRVERFQDISEEEMQRCGILKTDEGKYYVLNTYEFIDHKRQKRLFDTPTDAYKHLWKKVSRVKPWDKNPLVCVYDFELLRAGIDFEENKLETILKDGTE